VLRWERDQNGNITTGQDVSVLPQCSGGSEIKTNEPGACAVFCPYHSAPVGARSKHSGGRAGSRRPLTTVLRWERDQNARFFSSASRFSLPQCSGGSEIKTQVADHGAQREPYHSAPVGARSKLDLLFEQPPPKVLTTVLRWERDQNVIRKA